MKCSKFQPPFSFSEKCHCVWYGNDYLEDVFCYLAYSKRTWKWLDGPLWLQYYIKYGVYFFIGESDGAMGIPYRNNVKCTNLTDYILKWYTHIAILQMKWNSQLFGYSGNIISYNIVLILFGRLVVLISFLAILTILSRTCVPWLLKLMISLSSQVWLLVIYILLKIQNLSYIYI